jgi:hypothetical protein
MVRDASIPTVRIEELQVIMYRRVDSAVRHQKGHFYRTPLLSCCTMQSIGVLVANLKK